MFTLVYNTISLYRQEISLKYDLYFIFDADFLTLPEPQLGVQIINIEWMHLVMSVKHAELKFTKKNISTENFCSDENF